MRDDIRAASQIYSGSLLPKRREIVNGECEYKFDGYDENGDIWYMCITHNELALSDIAPCAAYIEIPYKEREST